MHISNNSQSASNNGAFNHVVYYLLKIKVGGWKQMNTGLKYLLQYFSIFMKIYQVVSNEELITEIPGGPKKNLPKIHFHITKVKRKFSQKMFLRILI